MLRLVSASVGGWVFFFKYRGLLFVGWIFCLLGGDSVLVGTPGGVFRLCSVCPKT